MDINYKILWFEDTEESFETLSRRTQRYVERKNLRCEIKRINGIDDFNISEYDLNSYEVLVVDLQLANSSKGFDVIQTIRASNYVNDILFYSSAGVGTLEAAMKEHRLEGVFLSERENRMFMEKIQKLIDKSVRRSENVINIRGIVMDETSEFDSQMNDIIRAAYDLISDEEKAGLRKYINKELLKPRAKDLTKLTEKYAPEADWSISDLLDEREFVSAMRSRLVNKILRLTAHDSFVHAVEQGSKYLPEVISAENGDLIFYEMYEKQVMCFRNKLAHVKQINAARPVLIGTINGTEYHCDSAFCTMMRQTLIKYQNWFNAVYAELERGE